MPRLSVGCLAVTLWGALAGRLPAQSAPRINIYRFVLDVDVPESPALVALDMAGSHVLRASSPKPIAASLVHRSAEGGRWATGVALDIVPYFFVGGGERRLADYRAMSVAGRLKRVLTKTALSIAAFADPDNPGALLTGLGVRTTFHDPHDPIGSTRLPEEVDSALAAHHAALTSSAEEETEDRGVDLTPLYAAARRAVRHQGDVQVSAGFGLAGRLAGATLVSDSIGRFRPTLWLSAQHAFGPKMDLLVTGQLRNAFRAGGKFRVGAGLQRKSRPADFRAELYYDAVDRGLYPGLSVEVHAMTGVEAVAALTSETPLPQAPNGSRVRFGVLVRWYAAHRG